MKQLYIFVIFTIILGSWNLDVSAQNVNFPDANLAAVVRTKLGLAADANIPQTSLAEMTTLNTAFNVGVTDLTGLEYATALTELTLSRNQITDITPLSGLTTLTLLYLDDNQIEGITPLSNLTNLETLGLRGSPILNFTPLSNLTKLRNLELTDTGFSNSDISILSPLTSINGLLLSRNEISNTSSLATVLSGMMDLNDLKLASNQISDLAPFRRLTNLPNLQGLDLSRNQISDIDPLKHFTTLQLLYLDNNRITNIKPLESLIDLWLLFLHNNQISDLSPLESLTKLNTLSICWNRYTDITPLENLPDLGKLDYVNFTIFGRLTIDREFWEDPANADMVAMLTQVDRVSLCEPLPDPPPPTIEPRADQTSEPEVPRRRRIITQCGLGWTPHSQYQCLGELPKVMIYALEFEYDAESHGTYTCKAIEIRTGDDSIENLAGWSLYLGTLYNPSSVPLTIPEEYSQVTDNILRITPEMLGLETFPCNTVGGISHPLPGVQYVLKTDENILVDTAYSCFLWGQTAYTTVNGENVESPRRISSAALREMEMPRLERYIWDNTGVYITYMDLEAFTWDRVVLSDWLLPTSEVSAPGAPSALQRKLVGTWGALKKQ